MLLKQIWLTGASNLQVASGKRPMKVACHDQYACLAHAAKPKRDDATITGWSSMVAGSDPSCLGLWGSMLWTCDLVCS